MNKFSLSFAFFALGFAAFLSACSDDKSSSPAELCKNGPSNECLVGKWSFVGIVEDDYTSCRGTLDIGENRYDFIGSWDNYEMNGKGNWFLEETEEGTEININCDVGDCDDGTQRGGIVTISEDGRTMTIRNHSRKAAISWYENGQISHPTEKFTRQ